MALSQSTFHSCRCKHLRMWFCDYPDGYDTVSDVACPVSTMTGCSARSMVCTRRWTLSRRWTKPAYISRCCDSWRRGTVVLSLDDGDSNEFNDRLLTGLIACSEVSRSDSVTRSTSSMSSILCPGLYTRAALWNVVSEQSRAPIASVMYQIGRHARPAVLRGEVLGIVFVFHQQVYFRSKHRAVFARLLHQTPAATTTALIPCFVCARLVCHRLL